MPPALPLPCEGVVFDLDGILIDSELGWRRATRKVVVDLGGTWDDAVHDLVLGTGPQEAARVVATYLGNGHEPGDVSERMLAAARREFAAGVAVRSGARQLVHALCGRLPLAVATNSSRVLADHALASTGLAGSFDAVVTADDVAAAKPAPDPYLAACARCGARPERSVAIEDSPAGTRSARAAGLWVVGCPSMPGVALPEAHTVVASLHEIDAEALIQSRCVTGSRGSRESPT